MDRRPVRDNLEEIHKTARQSHVKPGLRTWPGVRKMGMMLAACSLNFFKAISCAALKLGFGTGFRATEEFKTSGHSTPTSASPRKTLAMKKFRQIQSIRRGLPITQRLAKYISGRQRACKRCRRFQYGRRLWHVFEWRTRKHQQAKGIISGGLVAMVWASDTRQRNATLGQQHPLRRLPSSCPMAISGVNHRRRILYGIGNPAAEKFDGGGFSTPTSDKRAFSVEKTSRWQASENPRTTGTHLPRNKSQGFPAGARGVSAKMISRP